MKFHELTLTSFPKAKRVGRGISAGGGKTAGRGTKGQKARTGKKIKPGFEGGQTKLAMRLPKVRGFKQPNKVTYQTVQLSDLINLKAKTIGLAELRKAGLIGSTRQPVKVLGSIAVSEAMTVTVQAITSTALASIEKAGGKVVLKKLVRPVAKATAKKNTVSE
ncbi:50S ribosomal protein L15 [Candidatus Saccharibacteria bacterium]|nr:50S ribosomal protein L15 [Candidatus Saccharibacteria bacterium]